MTTALFATLLLSSTTGAGAPRLKLELVSGPSVKGVDDMEVRFRPMGSTDVYFNGRSVRLEVRSAAGDLLRYAWTDKPDLSPDYVRLRPGQTTSRVLDARRYHLETREKYTATAVFDDRGDDIRGEAPSGAIWVIGPIRSNSIAIQRGGSNVRPHSTADAGRQ